MDKTLITCGCANTYERFHSHDYTLSRRKLQGYRGYRRRFQSPTAQRYCWAQWWGKTSLLQSIDFLRAFFMSSLELYVQEKGWHLRELLNLRATAPLLLSKADAEKRVPPRRASPSIRWNISTDLQADAHGHGAGTYSCSVSLSSTARGVNEVLDFAGADGETIRLLDRTSRHAKVLNRETNENSSSELFAPLSSLMATIDPSRDRARYPELLRFREWVEGFRLFSLWDPKALRSADRGKHDELGSGGEHLASFLALLKQREPDNFKHLMQRVKRVFPYIADISVSGGRGWGWRMIQQHEDFSGRRSSVGSQQMSDGVLRFLAAATLLYLDNPPPVLMFEEPEDGIHPQLLREVVSILRELTLQKPPRRSQVFFTTHSPYVLDEFLNYPEEVFIVDRHKVDGGVAVTQLSDLDEAQRAKLNEAFPSLGEAWFAGLIGGTARGR